MPRETRFYLICNVTITSLFILVFLLCLQLSGNGQIARRPTVVYPTVVYNAIKYDETQKRRKDKITISPAACAFLNFENEYLVFDSDEKIDTVQLTDVVMCLKGLHTNRQYVLLMKKEMNIRFEIYFCSATKGKAFYRLVKDRGVKCKIDHPIVQYALLPITLFLGSFPGVEVKDPLVPDCCTAETQK